MKKRLLFILFVTLTVTVFSQTTYIVNSTADLPDINLNDNDCVTANGNCTLRAAIQNANKTNNKDTIEFNIPGNAPFTITVNSVYGVMEPIQEPLIIDGRTQLNYINSPIIEIDGSSLPIGSNGVQLLSGSTGSEIYGLSIGGFKRQDISPFGFGFGVLSKTGNHIFQSNYIGIKPDGTTINSNGDGLFFDNTGGNLVGGMQPNQGNVISGNGSGLTFQGATTNSAATNNIVQGNLIGTDATGTLNKGNTFNVQFIDAPNNTLGGNIAAARNIISGANSSTNNTVGTGIAIKGSESYGNSIIGNYIGTDITGTQSIPNVRGGVLILYGANNNKIGTDNVGEGNLISGNGQYGVYLQGGDILDPVDSNSIKGNYIGVDVTGNVALPNLFGIMMFTGENNNNSIGGTTPNSKNVISGNTSAGIVIGKGNNNQVIGNYIGTNASGTTAVANNSGILLEDGNNTIGGQVPGSRNIISGNITGINISKSTSSGATVIGNYIGLNASGNGALPNGTGVTLSSTSTNSIIGGTDPLERNVISGNTYDGIFVLGSSHTIQNNYIGLDASGNAALPNATGIFLATAATNIVVGGTDTLKRNIISGNTAYGIEIAGSLNTIQNNYIGTNALGTTAIANYFGVYLRGGNNTIGGQVAGSRNIISGNNSGIYISESSTSGSSVKSNYIGLNASGNAALPNKTGIYLTPTTTNIFIGGTDPLERNIISGNTDSGISISGSSHTIQNNYIGLNASGSGALPNTTGISLSSTSTNSIIGGANPLARNIISGNTSYGISVSGTSHTMKNNYIGLDALGIVALPNVTGILLLPSSANCIVGGPDTSDRNIISGNSDVGIYGYGASHIIRNNYIGLNPSGNGVIKNGNVGFTFNGTSTNTQVSENTISGNGTVSNSSRNVNFFGANGVHFFSNKVGTLPDGITGVVNIGSGILINSASNNIIGGDSEIKGNIIGNHNSNAIIVISGSSDNVLSYNKIGVGADGTTNLGNSSAGIFIGGTNTGNSISHNLIVNNQKGVELSPSSGTPTRVTISENSIYNNSVLGIDLVGTTANDVDDPDTGVNNLQNTPEISAINYLGGGTIEITYAVPSSITNSAYPLTIEFFGAVSGQGKFFINSDTYTAVGSKTVTLNLPSGYNPTDFNNIVATATDANGNTSEFGVSINYTLSIAQLENHSVKIYPNPVSDRLFIQSPASESYQLKLVNVLGEVILIKNNNTSSTSLDVSNLSKGLYFLNIGSENNSNQTIKFIKN